MVVDDDPTSAALLARMLMHAGCEVRSTTDAEHGVKLALGEDVDLVSLDIRMPQLSGFEVLSLIRSHEHSRRSPSVPVVAVTGQVEPVDRARSLAAGFVAHLGKPVHGNEVAACVARAMDLRGELYRTRYSRDHSSIVARLRAMIALDGDDRFPALAGLTLALEQQCSDRLRQALVDAYAGSLASALQHVHAMEDAATALGATRLAAHCRALRSALPQGRDEFEHEAALLRAELDRVVYTLRERALI